MDEFLAMGRQVLASQPFSVWIGAEMLDFAEGRVELALPICERLTQQYGSLHGGVLSYLADNALTFAGGSVLGIQVITAEYKINFLRPASGERLLARATVVHATRRQAVCRCDLFMVQNGVETLCATAQGTIVTYGRSE